MFDILHVFYNGLSTWLRIGKILAMDHDMFAGWRGISLQEKSKLETDNSVSNPSGNGIPDGLETEFSVFKTLVSNCVRLNSVSNQRPN